VTLETERQAGSQSKQHHPSTDRIDRPAITDQTNPPPTSSQQAPKKAAAGAKKSGGKKSGPKANALFVSEPRSFRVGGAIRVRGRLCCALPCLAWLE